MFKIDAKKKQSEQMYDKIIREDMLFIGYSLSAKTGEASNKQFECVLYFYIVSLLIILSFIFNLVYQGITGYL